MDLPTVTRLLCELGVDRNPSNLATMIRFVQRTEGSEECFGSSGERCGHLGCAWRAICPRSEDAGARARPVVVPSWPRPH